MSSSRRAGTGPGDRSHKYIIRDDNSKVERPVHLKKNRHELQNEIIKVSQLLSFVPNSFGDRHIPRRYNNYDSQQNVVCPIIMNGTVQCDSDFVKVKDDDGFWRPYAVQESLKTNINLSKESVLFFHDYLTRDILNKSLGRRFDFHQNVEVTVNKQKLDWPCLPRRKAIAVTEISHVLSNYCYYSDLSVITWSRTGKMTASFGEDLVIWIPKAKSSITYDLKGITCLAYNFDGKYLAVGVKLEDKLPQVQIWDLSSDSLGVFITSYRYCRPKDEVRSLVWDPKSVFIVSGMLSGNVYIHNCGFSLKILKKLRCAEHCITAVQLSANQAFLSASDKSGNVFVWNMQTYGIVFKWNGKEANRALTAWHPWKEAYLIIATRLPASIQLVDVRAHETIAHYHRTDELCRIDAITFSPRSAELVVSVTIFDDTEISYEILVLASLNRVVDLLSIHDGCTKCLLWNSDGSMLATAGDDNMLNVWNFFGYSELGPVKLSPKQKFVNSKFMLGNPSLLR